MPTFLPVSFSSSSVPDFRMKTNLLRLVSICAFTVWCGAAALAHTAEEPVLRRNNDPWLKRHLGFVEIAKQETECRLLFLGDSITDHWDTKALELWDRHYAPLKALNFGVSGDRTQHLLWRLQNGELGRLKPEIVVLLIGTNNLGFNSDNRTPRNTLPEVADGVRANVAYLRERLPEAKIILLGIFPRGEKDSSLRADTVEVNRRIAKLHDGRHVFFLDLGPKFLEADGTLPKDIMPDLLHPNRKGYEIWAEGMNPLLAQLRK